MFLLFVCPKCFIISYQFLFYSKLFSDCFEYRCNATTEVYMHWTLFCVIECTSTTACGWILCMYCRLKGCYYMYRVVEYVGSSNTFIILDTIALAHYCRLIPEKLWFSRHRVRRRIFFDPGRQVHKLFIWIPAYSICILSMIFKISSLVVVIFQVTSF